MIVGVDLGASALKIVAMDGDKVLFTYLENERKRNLYNLIPRLLEKNGYKQEDCRIVALTGVGVEYCTLENTAEIVNVPEIEATGCGGTYLADLEQAVVVSIGTGTSLVLAENGKYSHIGGSGVGSGTLRGIAKKIMGINNVHEFVSFAEKGDRKKVDLLIKDLFSGAETLPMDLTASNLAKCSDEASEEDWAAAYVNMVLEVAGSHAALACSGYKIKNIIITGGLSQSEIAKECYANFDRLYPQTYIVPEYSGFATAIGATRRALLGA